MQEHPNSTVDLNAVRETTDALLWAFEKRPLSSALQRIASERPDDFGFNNIEEAREAIKEFHSEDDRRDRVVSLCDAIVQMHLDKFFAQCAPNSQEKEKSIVAGLVLVYMEMGRFDRVSSLVSDIAQHGAAEALEKSAEVESGGTFGHMLAGVWATIEVIVVLLMIGAVDSGFQTLMISSLAFIYAGLSFAITSLNRSNGLATFDQSAELNRIRFLLKDRLADTDQMHTAQDNLLKAIKKAEVRHHIYIAKIAVIELIGIAQILRTVFRG